MKHTSIRLSEDHAARIAESGESPTAIIKKSLDLYFGIPDPARELMDEHIRLYHSAQPEHVVSTEKPQSASVPQDVAQDEHNVPIAAHKLSTEARQALSFIAAELRDGREPTTREVADVVQMTQVGISRKLGELGIASQNTKRQMRPVRIYPRHLKDKIDEILKSN